MIRSTFDYIAGYFGSGKGVVIPKFREPYFRQAFLATVPKLLKERAMVGDSQVFNKLPHYEEWFIRQMDFCSACHEGPSLGLFSINRIDGQVTEIFGACVGLGKKTGDITILSRPVRWDTPAFDERFVSASCCKNLLLVPPTGIRQDLPAWACQSSLKWGGDLATLRIVLHGALPPTINPERYRRCLIHRENRTVGTIITTAYTDTESDAIEQFAEGSKYARVFGAVDADLEKMFNGKPLLVIESERP
jgi:hypothetical protein